MGVLLLLQVCSVCVVLLQRVFSPAAACSCTQARQEHLERFLL